MNANRPPEVRAELERLAKLADEFNGLRKLIDERFAPVLRQEPSGDCLPSKGAPSACGLANELGQISAAFESAAADFRSILNRCEL